MPGCLRGPDPAPWQVFDATPVVVVQQGVHDLVVVDQNAGQVFACLIMIETVGIINKFIFGDWSKVCIGKNSLYVSAPQTPSTIIP